MKHRTYIYPFMNHVYKYTTGCSFFSKMSITLYEHAHFKGRTVTLTSSTPDLSHVNDFNDIASSVKVSEGKWRLCEDINYQGKYYDVGPGSYDIDVIREKIGNDVISSVQKL